MDWQRNLATAHSAFCCRDWVVVRHHALNAKAPRYADMWGAVQLHTLLFGGVYAAMLALPFTRWRVSLQNLLASNAAATVPRLLHMPLLLHDCYIELHDHTAVLDYAG